MTTKTELQATVQILKSLYREEEQLRQLIKQHEQVLKDFMESKNTEHLDLGTAVVHWTQVISKVFDLKKFRADFGNVDEYMIDRLSRRFKVA